MKNKKINTQDLLNKIEKVTKARIAQQNVVSLDQFREVSHKLEAKTILAIEDDDSMRSALLRIFEPLGYIVKLAADATELNKVLDDRPIDLIIMDVGLPWIDGFELATMLKENRDLKSIPLVFLSGHRTDEDLKKALDLGASEFFKKPFDRENLVQVVNNLLKK